MRLPHLPRFRARQPLVASAAELDLTLLSAGGSRDPYEVAADLVGDLRRSRVTNDVRLHALGAALITESVHAYRSRGHTPAEAHEHLRRTDPDLALVVEAIAATFVKRERAAHEAAAAVDAVERLLRRDVS